MLEISAETLGAEGGPENVLRHAVGVFLPFGEGFDEIAE